MKRTIDMGVWVLDMGVWFCLNGCIETFGVLGRFSGSSGSRICFV